MGSASSRDMSRQRRSSGLSNEADTATLGRSFAYNRHSLVISIAGLSYLRPEPRQLNLRTSNDRTEQRRIHLFLPGCAYHTNHNVDRVSSVPHVSPFKLSIMFILTYMWSLIQAESTSLLSYLSQITFCKLSFFSPSRIAQHGYN